MQELNISELRDIQLRILSSVHQFCVDNNLRYSLSGGTMIGAIRHKGFIPWDDDVDLMMPRKDYEYLIKHFNESFDDIKVLTYRNCDKYPFLFAKLYDTNTIRIEYWGETGVNIDVFPIDGLPDTESAASFNKKIQLFKSLAHRSTAPSAQMSFQTRLKRFLVKAVLPSRNWLINWIENKLTASSIEKSPVSGAFVGSYGEKEYMPSSVFSSYVNVEFEGKEFACIENYDYYLSHLYGDYMSLPPIENRVAHEFKAFRL